MKQKIWLLKSPPAISIINPFLSDCRLYPVTSIDVFGKPAYCLKNNMGSDFCILEEDLANSGWKPVYNTEIIIGGFVMVGIISFFTWLLILIGNL